MQKVSLARAPGNLTIVHGSRLICWTPWWLHAATQAGSPFRSSDVGMALQ